MFDLIVRTVLAPCCLLLAGAAELPPPTPAEVRAALEVLKRAHVHAEDIHHSFKYSTLGAKAVAISAVTLVASGAVGLMSPPRILDTIAIVVFEGAFWAVPITSGLTVLAFTVEGAIYLSQHSIGSAEAADLESGFLNDPASLQRYFDLPVEDQLRFAGPRLHRVMTELARAYARGELAPPR